VPLLPTSSRYRKRVDGRSLLARAPEAIAERYAGWKTGRFVWCGRVLCGYGKTTITFNVAPFYPLLAGPRPAAAERLAARKENWPARKTHSYRDWNLFGPRGT